MMMWWWIIGFGFLFFVIFFYAAKNKKGPAEKGPKSPIHILEERYAKGEITKEEFENQKETLKENR